MSDQSTESHKSSLNHPVRVGLALPHGFIGTNISRLADLAVEMEQLGYHHLSVYDHVLGGVHEDREPPLTGPYTQHDVFHEPFVVFGYLAGLTSTLEFVTSVLVLPQRQTALVAKQAAQVALLSNNRLRLGVGAGWNYVEYDALGHSFSRRGAMFDEQLEVLQDLWRHELVTKQTELHNIDRAGINPRPLQPIPIWLGGYSAPAQRRAVRHGSGFIFSRPSDAERDLPSLREKLAAANRNPNEFGVDILVHYQDSVQKMATDVELCKELGATHITLTGKPFNEMEPAALNEILGEFLSHITTLG